MTKALYPTLNGFQNTNILDFIGIDLQWILVQHNEVSQHIFC